MAVSLAGAALATSDNLAEGVADGLDAHLAGLSQHFAGQTDACLLVDGQQLRVHSALLAVGSTVLSEIFSTAQAGSADERNKDGKFCVTMAGHTLSDTCAVLKFLYERITLGLDSPSKRLWQSLEKARLIIHFLHKYDMKGIMQECEHCLCEKTEEADGRLIFSSTDVTIAWANLAEKFSLNKLQSKVELFMVTCVDADFWQSATQQLSRTCLSMVLQAKELERAAMNAYFASHYKQCLDIVASGAEVLERDCAKTSREDFGCHIGWCVACCPLQLPKYVAGGYVSGETLLRLQEGAISSNKRKHHAT
ncbi:hypothetical protein ABBQ38_005876 [Trebouxia sp. C0009 RCD-2024]